MSACRGRIVYSHRYWSSLNIVSISQIHLVVVVPFVVPIVIHRTLLMIAQGGVVDDFLGLLIMVSRLWRKHNIRMPYESLVLFDCITFLSCHHPICRLMNCFMKSIGAAREGNLKRENKIWNQYCIEFYRRKSLIYTGTLTGTWLICILHDQCITYGEPKQHHNWGTYLITKNKCTFNTFSRPCK